MYLFVALVGQIASESGQTCLVGQSQDLFVGTIVWKFPICLVARYISQCQSHRWVDTSSFEDDWDAASTGFIVPICPNPCKFGMINPLIPASHFREKLNPPASSVLQFSSSPCTVFSTCKVGVSQFQLQILCTYQSLNAIQVTTHKLSQPPQVVPNGKFSCQRLLLSGAPSEIMIIHLISYHVSYHVIIFLAKSQVPDWTHTCFGIPPQTAATVHWDSLLVIGGFDSKHNLRDAWCLDTEDHTCKRRSSIFDGWLWWESLEKADAKQSHTFERQQEMARRPEFAWCITHHHTRANQPIIRPFEGHTPMQMLSRIRLSQSPTFWPTLHPQGASENALTQYVHILLRCMPSLGVRCLKYDEDLFKIFKVRMWWHHVRVDQTPGSLHRMKTTPVLWCAHGWTITNIITNTHKLYDINWYHGTWMFIRVHACACTHTFDTYWYIMILYWIYSYTIRVVPANDFCNVCAAMCCVLQPAPGW